MESLLHSLRYEGRLFPVRAPADFAVPDQFPPLSRFDRIHIQMELFHCRLRPQHHTYNQKPTGQESYSFLLRKQECHCNTGLLSVCRFHLRYTISSLLHVPPARHASEPPCGIHCQNVLPDHTCQTDTAEFLLHIHPQIRFLPSLLIRESDKKNLFHFLCPELTPVPSLPAFHTIMFSLCHKFCCKSYPTLKAESKLLPHRMLRPRFPAVYR